MTREYLETLRAKLVSAVAYGVPTNGNLAWAKAQLNAVECALARLPPAN